MQGEGCQDGARVGEDIVRQVGGAVWSGVGSLDTRARQQEIDVADDTGEVFKVNPACSREVRRVPVQDLFFPNKIIRKIRDAT